jgi:hypothetical protein
MRPVGGPGIVVGVVVATTTGATSVAHPANNAVAANAAHEIRGLVPGEDAARDVSAAGAEGRVVPLGLDPEAHEQVVEAFVAHHTEVNREPPLPGRLDSVHRVVVLEKVAETLGHTHGDASQVFGVGELGGYLDLVGRGCETSACHRRVGHEVDAEVLQAVVPVASVDVPRAELPEHLVRLDLPVRGLHRAGLEVAEAHGGLLFDAVAHGLQARRFGEVDHHDPHERLELVERGIERGVWPDRALADDEAGKIELEGADRARGQRPHVAEPMGAIHRQRLGLLVVGERVGLVDQLSVAL